WSTLAIAPMVFQLRVVIGTPYSRSSAPRNPMTFMWRRYIPMTNRFRLVRIFISHGPLDGNRMGVDGVKRGCWDSTLTKRTTPPRTDCPSKGLFEIRVATSRPWQTAISATNGSLRATSARAWAWVIRCRMTSVPAAPILTAPRCCNASASLVGRKVLWPPTLTPLRKTTSATRFPQQAARALTVYPRGGTRGSGAVALDNLEVLAEERRGGIRDTGNLIGCLPIKFEIEFSPGPTVAPVSEMLELAAPQWSLCQRGSSDREAHSRRLARNSPLLWACFGVSDDAARDEASAAVVLTREHKHRVTSGNQLAAVHCLVRGERENPRPRIDNLRFDREHHDGPGSRHDAQSYNRPRLKLRDSRICARLPTETQANMCMHPV